MGVRNIWLGQIPETFVRSGPARAPLPLQPAMKSRLLIMPNEVHDYILHRSWHRVFEATHEFLDRYLIQPGS